MKLTDTQLEIIDSIINIVKTWKDIDTVDSSTHYTIIEEFLYSDLDEMIPCKQIECLKNELSKILNRILYLYKYCYPQ